MGDAEIVPERAKRVAVVGDSIVGYSGGYYTRRLNEYGLGVKFDHFGVSGESTEAMRKRLPGIVGSGKYSELIIAEGVNDLAKRGGGSEENWEKNLLNSETNTKEMIKIAERNGIERVLLVEVAPWGGSDNSNPVKEERTLEYNEMLARVAQETGAVLISVHENMQGEKGKLRDEFAGTRMDGKKDWLHPADAGLEVIAKRIAESAYASRLWKGIMSGKYETLSEYMKRIVPERKQERIAMRY